MTQLFISHTESDSGWVERQLIPALTDAGLECHHEALFSLGKPRLLEFEEAIKQSDRILLICSPAYFADESLQIVDLLAARHGEETKSWPVIPIIRHAVELPLWLRILESLDATDQASWPDALTRLCNSLKVGTPQEPKRPRCPYPGMKPFERDSEFPFYGRQDEVGEIIERLRLHPFLAVIGASGSGKSSVVHAGLIPELNRTQLLGEGDWLTSSFRPSEGNHDQTIVGRLEAHLGGQVQDTESAKASVDSFLQVARETSQPNAQQLLLVVDQFEEVYTLQKERDEKYRLNKDDADQFQRALLTLAEVPGCYVVLTVRADFFGDLMESPIWDKGVKDHRFELTTLGDEGMHQAIVQPALDQDVCIDQVLVERLLSEAGSEPGILPFLQETLVLLWGKLRWRYLSALDYESMVKGRRAEFRSGLEVAMAQRADAAISSLPDEEHRLVARRILLRLVQFGEGRLHTRRQQTVAQLSSAHSDDGIFDATLNHLIGGLHKRLGIDSQRTQAELRETRLLTVGDPRAGRRTLDENKNKDEKNIGSDQRSVDIAHDKLITGWPALSDDEKGWIVLRRQAEEMRRDLEGKVERWVDLGRSRFGGGLLDKIELTECDKWIESNEVAEIGEVPELDQLQRVSQQRLWFRRAGVIAIPVLMIVAMGFWIWGTHQLAEKEKERANTAEKLLAEESQRILAERDARIAAQNFAREQQFRSEAFERRAYLFQIRAASMYYEQCDGKRLGTTLDATRDSRFRDLEWDVLNKLGDVSKDVLIEQQAEISSVSFDSNSQNVAYADTDLGITLFELGKQEPQRRLRGHKKTPNRIRFSSGGSQLLSAALDGSVRIWDLKNSNGCKVIRGRAGGTLQGGSYLKAISDATSRFIATSALDGQMRLFDFESLELVKSLGVHASMVADVEFSSDGSRLFISNNDGDSFLWSVREEQLISHLDGPECPANVMAFDEEETHAFVGYANGQILRWDLENAIANLAIAAHTGPVSSLTKSDQIGMLISTGNDGSVKSWDLQSGQLIHIYRGHRDRINDACIVSSDKLLTASDDGTLRAWDLASSVFPLRFPVPDLQKEEKVVLCLSGQVRLHVESEGKPSSRDHVDTTRFIRFERDTSRLNVECGKNQRLVDCHPTADVALLTEFPDQLVLRKDGKDDCRCRVGSNEYLSDACFSPSGDRVLGVTDGFMYIWDLESGNLLCRLQVDIADPQTIGIDRQSGNFAVLRGPSWGRPEEAVFFELFPQ